MSLSKMELAKSKIALHAGFWISLTSKLEFVEKPEISTAGTDGRRIYYNPEFVNELTLKQTIGLILHEVGHNMLAHPARIGERDKQVANIAMDIALNELLNKYFDESGVRQTLDAELPPGGLFGDDPIYKKYAGWNWERIYHDLMDQVQKNGGGKGKGSGLPKQFDEVMQGMNEDGTPMTPQEAEALAKEWAMAAQQAATMAKQRGTLPGFMEELIADMTHPKVDWRAQVRDFFSKIAKDEQSYRRFNRRFMHADTYLPGMYSEHLGLIRFYVDTSGSMGSEEFKLGMGALNDIFEELRPEAIQFVQCDTRIVSDETLTPDDLPLTAKEFKGRGGTTLTPMFQHNLAQKEDAELVVCLTDGYHEQIEHTLEPHCPMLWLVTTEHTDSAEKSFGRVIRVVV